MRKLIMFTLSVVLFSSCRKDTTQPDLDAGTIKSQGVWPFVRGNYWVYKDTTYWTDGTVRTVGPHDTLRVFDSTSYSGRMYYSIESPNIYYGQPDDSTVEEYNSILNQLRVA